MTSLGFGIICIYFAVTILRMPEKKFKKKLDSITGAEKESPQGYYQLIRNLFWAVGAAGAAMILLRFF